MSKEVGFWLEKCALFQLGTELVLAENVKDLSEVEKVFCRAVAENQNVI